MSVCRTEICSPVAGRTWAKSSDLGGKVVPPVSVKLVLPLHTGGTRHQKVRYFLMSFAYSFNAGSRDVPDSSELFGVDYRS